MKRKCEDCGIEKERIKLFKVSNKLLCSDCSEKEIHKIFAKIKSSEGQRMSQYKRS